MKVSEVLNCSFSAWYTKFKYHTIKRTIVADAHRQEDSDSEGGEAEDDIDWTAEDIFTPVAEAPSFPVFEEQLKQVINRLGGQVFPKLNWMPPGFHLTSP